MEALAASVAVVVSIPFIYVIYLSIKRSEQQVTEPQPVVQTWLESDVQVRIEQELQVVRKTPQISHQQLEEQNYMPPQL